jgi:NAD(P)-dependent dehydrogenase (short-subunit alcohol dehydrogenase family)
MKGKVCMVTGATAGIGKVTALELAKLGATVVVVGRDAAKGEATVAEIKSASGNGDLHFLRCDFASQASVRALAAAYKAKFDRLHVLVNNAGAILGEHRTTEDGLEATFATNHIGYFLLTDLLLDVLKASAPARIVNVASEAHRSSKLDFDDLQFQRRGYAPMAAYGASKLANIAWSAELARRLEGTGVTSNSLHPGVIASNFGQTGPGWMRFGLKLVTPFLTTPEKGAATTLYLATSPEAEGVTGKYFKNKKPATPTAQARDPETGRRLWTVSEALVAKSAAQAA